MFNRTSLPGALRTVLRGKWIRASVTHWPILSYPTALRQFITLLITRSQNHLILCNARNKSIKSKVLKHFALNGLSVIQKNDVVTWSGGAIPIMMMG